jgi:hypothetical protein
MPKAVANHGGGGIANRAGEIADLLQYRNVGSVFPEMTRSSMAGVDLVTLAAMLGHSRNQIVLRYTHPTEEHQFAAMEKRQRYMAR